ncbi:MAG: M48 family metalloprotease, partial [Dehalococcoidia bacterium]
ILGIANVLLPVDALVFPLMLLWMISGGLVFIPAAESFIARSMLDLREPTDSEAGVVDAAWQEVAGSAGIDASRYSIWIETREDINSCLPGGRFLAVPRTISRLPMRQQAAVLAHELSHHLGGHAWARLLVHWYAAPSRSVVRAYRASLRAVSGPIGCLSGAVLLLIGAIALYAILTTPEARPAIVALPLLPWLSRWAERRCDQVAADLGYGRDLLELFQWWQDSGFDEQRAGGVVRQVFSSHPTVANRIHALRTYMTENGLT